MSPLSAKDRRVLEIALILVCVGLACLLLVMQGYKMVIFNLFFLPVVLGAFFLGRYRAGVLVVFCVVCASGVTASTLTEFSTATSSTVIALAVALWAAVLAMVALLVGTLSDDRLEKMKELHEAYVGVVEVLSQYLQSAHPRLKARSIRVAELSQKVAMTMKFSPRQIDDIRVAALLYDVGNIEVTTKVIRRAVSSFEEGIDVGGKHTFQGLDLMLSLGSVLSGAIPLLLNQDDDVAGYGPAEAARTPAEIPPGAQIIRAVRAYVMLTADDAVGPELTHAEIFGRLRAERLEGSAPRVLEALEAVVAPASAVPKDEESPEELPVLMA
ncbi:MAG TPA: HD domain-containing phosphohydrolase [Thermoguttaceae bacterium]|nr:HD domain-containing phosphohydrolase [Thermoguttaceae bacterium]